MTPLDPRELRLSALEALGPFADPREVRALERAEVIVRRDVRVWEGSRGTIRGHLVVLRLPACELGRVLGSPSVQGALQAVIARAVSEDPLSALADLRFEWRASGGEMSAYRGEIPGEEGAQIPRAMHDFLLARGHASTAEIARRAEVRRSGSGDEIVVLLDPKDRLQGPEAQALVSCLRALLTRETTPRVRLA